MAFSATWMRTGAAGAVLALLAFAAPANAAPITSTTDLSTWEWDLGGTNGTVCKQTAPTASSTCYGESDSAAKNGNKDSFTSITKSVTTTNPVTHKKTTTTQANLNLTAEAYHVAQVTSGANKGAAQTSGSAGYFIDDFLGYYPGADYGLGVEQDVGSPDHSVDNACHTGTGAICQTDLIVFQLPTGLNANTLDIALSSFDTTENMDVTFFLGTPSNTTGGNALAAKIAANGGGVAGFNGVTFSDLSAANGFTSTTINGLFAHDDGIVSVQLTTPGPVEYLIVAASISSTAVRNGADNYNTGIDDFKVNAIAGTDAPTHPRYPRCGVIGYQGHITPCPEPASLALFGASLLGMAGFARRRKVALKRAA